MNYRRDIPSLSALAAFECAARHCSFTIAAKELSTSQPAVSRHIDNLESHLNCILFERSNNRLKLTKAGQRFYQAVIAGFEEIRNAVVELSAANPVPVFRIACTYDVAHCWLLPRFAALREALDDVDVQVVTSEGLPDFDDVNIGMFIVGGHSPRSHLRQERLLEEEVFPVCSPDFAARHAACLQSGDMQALQDLPLLHLNKENLGWATWSSWFGADGQESQMALPRATYYNYAFLLEAAIAGEGLALGWTGFVEEPLRTGRLVMAHKSKVKTGFGFYAIAKTNRPDQTIIDKAIASLQMPSADQAHCNDYSGRETR